MKILCVDTSSKEIAIGVFDGKKTLVEEYLSVDKNYNKVLIPLIDEALKKNGLNLVDMDVFASTLGPGSFTGIRVGMAAFKGFAQSLNKLYTGATVLEIMANSVKKDGIVWPAIDAGRSEVYTAKFAIRNSQSAIKGKYLMINREKLTKLVRETETVVTLKRENIAVEIRGKNSRINCVEACHVDMKSFAEIVMDRAKHISNKSLFSAAPVYIRPSEAEATLKRKGKGHNAKN